MISVRRGDKIIAAVFVCSDHAENVVIDLIAKSENGQMTESLEEIFGMVGVG
jgi:hypothetical protein